MHRRLELRTVEQWRVSYAFQRHFSLAFPLKRDILIFDYACEEAD